MKKTIQKIVFFLSRIGARTFLLLLYRTVFQITKYLLDDRFLTIWSRNSFYFNIINPGISDIDLTFFFAHNTPEEYRRRSLDRLSSLRRMLPIIGEANVYRDDEVGLYRAAGNYFELKRDPELFARLKRPWTEERIASDAIAFILRALWCDYPYLKRFPKHRRHKWNYIFRALNEELNLELKIEMPSPKIITENLLLVAPWLRQDVSVLIKLFDNRKDDRFALSYLRLYPHYWLGDYWNHAKFKEFLSSLASLSPEALGVVKSQIAWEIWGIYSQMYLLDKTGLHYHFLNLKKVLEEICPKTDPLLNDIDTAEGMLKRLTSS